MEENRLRSVVGRTYPPRATDARDARFETCCSTLAGLPVEGVFRAGGNKDPHMLPSGQVGRCSRGIRAAGPVSMAAVNAMVCMKATQSVVTNAPLPC